MAESSSSSSTSEKPPIEKVGLGFLLQDTPPIKLAIHQGSDTPTSVVTLDEETEFRNAIERDLCELTIQQAHIESIDEEMWDDVGTQKDSESLEDENEDKEGNEAINYSDGASNLGRYNQNNSTRKVNYPMRPDAEDCSYYMKFGSCKFGLNCKFNHPPRRKNQNVEERTNYREENSERGGQTECKYYLTSAGCKYGKDCIYSHCSDRSSAGPMPECNFLGLPIRIVCTSAEF